MTLPKKDYVSFFQNFDNIYISFSGGKDSGVLLNLCIDYIRKHNLKRKIGMFHMDLEIQYNMTIDYVERTFKENQRHPGYISYLRTFSSNDMYVHV